MSQTALDIIEEVKKNNPIGTKFLVELEVTSEDGYNEMMSTLLLENKRKEFSDKYGCTLNKVFRKDIKAGEDGNDLINVLEKALDIAKKGC